MGLIDKLTGARPADEGVTPVTTDELRQRLLALGDGVSWTVRDGADDGCDLIATNVIVDADWELAHRHGNVEEKFTAKLKLHEDEHEVRVRSHESGSSWQAGQSLTPGQPDLNMVGQAQVPPPVTYSFNTATITDPLRDAVTAAGWGWKPVAVRL